MEQMAIECGTQQQQFMLQDSTKGDNSHANCERSYLMFKVIWNRTLSSNTKAEWLGPIWPSDDSSSTCEITIIQPLVFSKHVAQTNML
jgi:hypothetical protein